MRLTNRELQVVSLLCTGKKDQQIAKALCLSVRTVQNHLGRIYLKSGAQNRTQMIAIFKRKYGNFAMELILGGVDEKNYSSLEWRQICSILNG